MWRRKTNINKTRKIRTNKRNRKKKQKVMYKKNKSFNKILIPKI